MKQAVMVDDCGSGYDSGSFQFYVQGPQAGIYAPQGPLMTAQQLQLAQGAISLPLSDHS